MRLLKIGRDVSCDIVLHSDKVSALHAELTLLDNGDMLLEDKGSYNGTFVMGQPVKPGKPVKVVRGDAVTFADVELQWMQVPMPEDNSRYKAIWGVGSHFNNDIQLSGPTVSRYHATIKREKDNKTYIFDHSKNGTTVDGRKIAPNTACRITRKSVVVCGGVPLDMNRLDWPEPVWKYVGIAAAAIVILAGLGLGIWKWVGSASKMDDSELYARYNNSVVLLIGVYHYELEIEGINMATLPRDFPLPLKFVRSENGFRSVSGLFSDRIISQFGRYSGTGFFVSEDGKLVTNLHVAKPWLADNQIKGLEASLKEIYAKWAAQKDFVGIVTSDGATPYSAYTSLIKVKGVLDDILLIPQGRYISSENAVTCRVLSAGEDIDNDVALVQSERAELPSGCRYINVTDSMNVDDRQLHVGKHIYTIGFPFGLGLQDDKSEKGIQVLGRGGNIIQADTEYRFGFDAASFHGASGSPIFDEKGMLIGVLNSGVDVIQGFNYGIKAKYVKELLESPYKK